MKNTTGRKLLIVTLFAPSMTSIAGCYYHDRDYYYDREYAYRDRYRDGYYWRNRYSRDELENRHVIPDYPFGDRDFGHD